jgi:hypothetical protein
MASQPPQPDGKTCAAAALTVAAAYIYFLIFAQFGFLQAVQAAFGEGGKMVRPLMATMGLAGIAGSIIAARNFAGAASRRVLLGGFVGCGLAAAGSLGASGAAGFFGTAALTGLGAGLTTVALAGILRPALGPGKLGIVVGLGTGLAYGFCNLPGIFGADARTQAIIALLAAGLGATSGAALPARFPPDNAPGEEYSRAGIARWVVIFLAMVCVDSALFYLIQHTAELKQALWTGAARQGLNAGIHVGAAVSAGWAFDRGWMARSMILAAGMLLLAAFWIDGHHSGLSGAGLVYVASVSVYSTALVFYPARSGRAGVAALVYAVAGWGGSALGLGLAEGRDRLPPGLIAFAAAVLAMALAARRLASRPEQTMNENNRA